MNIIIQGTKELPQDRRRPVRRSISVASARWTRACDEDCAYRWHHPRQWGATEGLPRDHF